MPVTPMQEADRNEVAEFIERHWRSRTVMSRGQVYAPHEHEGLLQRREGRIVGLVTFRVGGQAMEVLTLNATLEGQRIGTSLMLQAIEVARSRNCGAIWLTTTNDNLRAIGLYQLLGFRMVAVHAGAVDEARKVRPQIPEVGYRGIPIHDEVVLELKLKPYLEVGA